MASSWPALTAAAAATGAVILLFPSSLSLTLSVVTPSADSSTHSTHLSHHLTLTSSLAPIFNTIKHIHTTGNCGISVDLPAPTQAASPELSTYAALFAEELGLVLEVAPEQAALVTSLFNQAGVPCSIIGSVLPEQSVDIKVAGQTALSGNTAALRLVLGVEGMCV